MNKERQCPDCGTPIGEKHRDGCDIERCRERGWTSLGCSCDANETERLAWTGNGLVLRNVASLAGTQNLSRGQGGYRATRGSWSK